MIKGLRLFFERASGLQLPALAVGVSLAFAPSTQASIVSNGLVVLIPGTGNSLIPGDPLFAGEESEDSALDKIELKGRYFSHIVVDTLESKGFETFIPIGLDPAGDVAENGERVFRQVEEFYQKRFPGGKVPVFMIGHSAGGLYGMKALDLNRSLPIKSLVLVSTPLEGSRFADIIFGDCEAIASCNRLQKKMTDIAKKLGMQGFEQMRKIRVKEFLKTLSLPADVSLYSVTGKQLSNPIARSGTVCPLCVSSKLLYRGRSDGIVSHDSAYGQNIQLKDRDGKTMHVKALYDLQIPLGHHEQAVSSVVLKLLRQKNTTWVKFQQHRFYDRIAEYLLEQKMAD